MPPCREDPAATVPGDVAVAKTRERRSAKTGVAVFQVDISNLEAESCGRRGEEGQSVGLASAAAPGERREMVQKEDEALRLASV